ncbi:MAG: hypothetical protein U5K37_10800 [Natrialbaceae archaeon]|nr:hypothetical protein [Natrialbaceae archaeon]
MLAGGATAVHSGAVSYVRADRDLEVVVEHDNDAYLGLRQLGAGGRSAEDGTPEQVRFAFPGVFETSLGDGLGTDSVYEFTTDANGPASLPGGGGPVEGLLQITNQGTELVEVSDAQPPTTGPKIELFDVTDPARSALRDDPVLLPVGDDFRVGFRIDTHGIAAGGGTGLGGAYEETISIIAEEPTTLL